MDDLLLLILIASIMGLSVLTTNWYFKPVMAVSIGNTGAFVIQEQVNTGNPVLDKEINKFYSCISKTHQDPPIIQIVDNCYSQNSIAGITGPGNHNHNNSNNNNNYDIIKTPSTRIATQPPGVLVEVP
ncbi:MAG: hypothetical protein WCF23_07660 [Candidatus Nitrosopolaris sp.]